MTTCGSKPEAGASLAVAVGAPPGSVSGAAAIGGLVEARALSSQASEPAPAPAMGAGFADGVAFPERREKVVAEGDGDDEEDDERRAADQAVPPGDDVPAEAVGDGERGDEGDREGDSEGIAVGVEVFREDALEIAGDIHMLLQVTRAGAGGCYKCYRGERDGGFVGLLAAVIGRLYDW